jgi:hypothetical protein
LPHSWGFAPGLEFGHFRMVEMYPYIHHPPVF